MEKLESGLYRVKYKPTLVGNHNVTILHRKQPIAKQPWSVQAFDPSRVRIFDMSDAFCDQPATFKGKFILKLETVDVLHTLFFATNDR